MERRSDPRRPPAAKKGREDVFDAWRDAAIVHFAYKSKPWEPLHYPTDYDAEFWAGLEGTLVGGWLKDRFAQAIEATRHDARARRGIFESTRRKRARARLLDGMLYDPWIALKPAGELLCTLARAAGAGSPASRFYAVHQYGAAIIRKAEDRELRARGPQN